MSIMSIAIAVNIDSNSAMMLMALALAVLVMAVVIDWGEGWGVSISVGDSASKILAETAIIPRTPRPGPTPLQRILWAVGRTLRRPCGGTEAGSKYWRAHRFEWDHELDSELPGRLDARPAHDCAEMNLTPGQAVAVYRMAMDNGLWDCGYGSPHSPSVALIQQGLIRRWSATDILLVNEAYDERRLPGRNVRRLSRLIVALTNAMYRLQYTCETSFMARELAPMGAKALLRLTTPNAYWAVLAALAQCDGNRALFWVLLKQNLGQPKYKLVQRWGSTKAQWGLLGVDVPHIVTVRPAPGMAAKTAKALLTGWSTIGRSDEVLTPVNVLWTMFGKQAPDYVKLVELDTHAAGQFVYDSPELARGAGQWILSHRKALRCLLGQDRQKTMANLRMIVGRWEQTWSTLNWAKVVDKARLQALTGLSMGVAQVAVDLNMSQAQAERYMTWREANMRREVSILPTIQIDGAQGGLEGDWRLQSLTADDARGPVLGLYTDCCQHPEGVGHECALHGHTNPLGGFWIVTYKGRIVAQSWVWGIVDDADPNTVVALCCDNIETLGTTYTEGVLKMYRKASRLLVTQHNLRCVTVGTTYGGVDLGALEVVEEPLVPQGYGGYRDSDEQCLLAGKDDKQS